MAKEKDGGKNNYTPIKNPELLNGEKETRSIHELAQSKRPEVKGPNESFVDLVNRRPAKQQVSLTPEIKARKEQPVRDKQSPVKEAEKEKEPEKDKE